MDQFKHKIAVVTGAAQGIGLAIAEHLHAEGARLLLVDCKEEALANTAARLRSGGLGSVQAFPADLADAAAIEALARKLASEAPRIDLLVNNAGIESDTPFSAITAQLFDHMMAVNLRAPLLLTQSLAGMFSPEGAAVVNISSIHADHAFPNSIPYACSKAGLVALTRNLALELGRRRVRVNAVCPGYIDTPMWDEWLRTASDPEKIARETQELHPLGRRGTPQDVAAAVAYLASPQAAWITGTCLVVDGGLTVRTHP